MPTGTRLDRRTFLKTTGAALGGTLLSGVAAAEGTTLTLLSYNDIQTAAAEDTTLPRMATLIDRRRAAADGPVVVLGAGDEIGPHALSPVSQWRAPVDVLNHVGPDVDTLGNHDLDYGVEGFTAAANASEFPWVATNLVSEDTGEPIDGAERTVVIEKDGVRVGVIGTVYEGLDGSVSDDLATAGLTVLNPVETVAEHEQRLREEEDADVVVVLNHIGVGTSEEIARATGVDAVLAGHDEVPHEPTEVEGTMVSEAEARAEYLSEITFTVADGEVTGASGRLLSTADVPKDETVSGIINEYRAEVRLDEVVTTSETALDARFSSNYHRETGYGNLVTDAMRAETGADVAITNAGGIRSNAVYGPGEITGGDVFNTLPFSNTVTTVELTGSQLVETLSSQIITMESWTGSQYGAEVSQQVSGVRFEWVAHEDAEALVRDVYVGGEPLSPGATYEVAVNSYMAGGGSGYPLADKPVLDDTGKLLATTVIDYLETKETIAPTVEGRMQRVDADLRDATVRVDGEGKVVLRFDAVADYAATGEGTFEMATKDGHTVAAERTVYDPDEGTLVVRFDDAELASLVGDEDEVALDLYGGYDSSEHERVYFEYSRVNADVTATVAETGTATTQEVGTPRSGA